MWWACLFLDSWMRETTVCSSKDMVDIGRSWRSNGHLQTRRLSIKYMRLSNAYLTKATISSGTVPHSLRCDGHIGNRAFFALLECSRRLTMLSYMLSCSLCRCHGEHKCRADPTLLQLPYLGEVRSP